jgi:hypothetical protein
MLQSDEEPVEFAARPKRNKTPKPKTMTMGAQSPPPRGVKQQSQHFGKDVQHEDGDSTEE